MTMLLVDGLPKSRNGDIAQIIIIIVVVILNTVRISSIFLQYVSAAVFE
jgi:hypothetical protein